MGEEKRDREMREGREKDVGHFENKEQNMSSRMSGPGEAGQVVLLSLCLRLAGHGQKIGWFGSSENLAKIFMIFILI